MHLFTVGRLHSSRSEQPRIRSLQSRPSEMNIGDLYNDKDEDSVSSKSNHSMRSSRRVDRHNMDNTFIASDYNSDSNSLCGSITSMKSSNHVIISKKNKSVYQATLLKLQSELLTNELTFNDVETMHPYDALSNQEGTVAIPTESIQWREIHFQQARRSYSAIGYLVKVKIFVTSLQVRFTVLIIYSYIVILLFRVN